MKSKKKKTGFNLPLLIALLVVLVLVSVSFSMRQLPPSNDLHKTTNGDSSPEQELPSFEPLNDTSLTPPELKAEAVAELDNVFTAVESSDESLSGLDWEE